MSFVKQVDKIESRFEFVTEIGDGTYGNVQKCVDRQTQEIVALKRIKLLHKDEGFPYTTIREVMILRELSHENIVILKSVFECLSEKNVYLVFEYCDYDLYALLYMPNLPEFHPLFMISMMKQLLSVLCYCSTQKVVHRDIKPANLFVTRGSILKLGDFGLARKLGDGRYSDKVVTLWYRSPELLMGCRKYGSEVDIWSAACVFYEMVVRKPIFIAKKSNETSQLMSIFELCGNPTDEIWPGWKNLEGSSQFRSAAPTPSRLAEFLRTTIPPQMGGLVDLLLRMLTLDPEKRITAEDALNHPFLRESGHFTDPQFLPRLEIPEIHQKKASEEKKNRSVKTSDRQRPDRVYPPRQSGGRI